MRDPIAIIGIGCRFPGANHTEAFWQLLQAGKDAVTEIPPERAILSHLNASEVEQIKIQQGGFLANIDQFDTHFFGISPQEAVSIDPQQRLLLEVTWEALEDAGQIPERLSGSQTSVFIGIFRHDYADLIQKAAIKEQPAVMSIALSGAANRISYHFDWHGTSLVVNTACSSSLVAVDLACRSLWSGEAPLALAGGVNLILSPSITTQLTKTGLVTAQGRCKAFAAEADGFIRSEGVGMVVLKPLSQAVTDGDRIYAVIRGSAVNHNGRSNGFTAPNLQAQEALLRQAYQQAGVSPGALHYIEAQGTGTLMGDALEMKALGRVLAEGRPVGKICVIGTVKTNIGHTEAASGIAGLIKTALVLHNRQIPPNLHFQNPNPYIEFAQLPVQVPTTLMPFPEGADSLKAGVSAFGIGGTNAHIVLEEAPSSPQHATYQAQRILTLSAKSETSLRNLAVRYQRFLEEHPDASIEQVCFTTNTRRSQFNHRLAIVAESTTQLRQQLNEFIDGNLTDRQFSGKASQKHKGTQDLKEVLTDVGCGKLIENNSNKTIEQLILLGLTEFHNSQSEYYQLVSAVLKRWTIGAKIDWVKLYENQLPALLSLPTYPFEHCSIWSNPSSRSLSMCEQLHRKHENESYVAPQNEVEQTLIQLWKARLNVELVSIDDNFFTLGGTSLLAIQLLTDLEKAFHQSLPLSAIFEAPTVEKLAKTIRQPNYSKYYSLVPIQPEGSKPLLFGIHILHYRSLAQHLGTEQPIYGLRYGLAAKTPKSTQTLPNRIEDLAAHYIEEMRSLQPQGPYFLMGISFGGKVAFEIAHQLVAQGQKVELLALLDTFLTTKSQPASLSHKITTLLQLKPTEVLQRLESRRKQKMNSQYELHHKLPLGEHCFNPYTPKVYSGKVIFFKAIDRRPSVFYNLESPELAWRELVSDGLEVYPVPGSHLGILEEPNVKILAQQLETCLAKESEA